MDKWSIVYSPSHDVVRFNLSMDKSKEALLNHLYLASASSVRDQNFLGNALVELVHMGDYRYPTAIGRIWIPQKCRSIRDSIFN